jgi:hypothetical protein
MFRFAVVIRCLLRPSSELRRAIEVLNRYIGGRRKRDPMADLRGIEDSDAEYTLVPQNHTTGNICPLTSPKPTR